MIPVTPVIIGIFLIASFFKVDFLYHVLYLLVAIVVVSRIWTRIAAKSVAAERQFESPALHGEDVRITISLVNRGWLPIPWLRLHDHLPLPLATVANVDHVVSLGPRGSRTIDVRTTARQRGWYVLGPIRIEVGDLFGFARHTIGFGTPERLTVYPKILPLGQRGFVSPLPFGAVRSRAALFDDPSRVIGAREYQPGDSLRSVHWSATAATGALQVRKIEPAMTVRSVVALEFATDAYPVESRFYASELAIIAAASVVSHLIDLRQEVGLTMTGIDPAASGQMAPLTLDPAKGNAARGRVLGALARVQMDNASTLATALTIATFAWGTTLIVIAPEITAELMVTLARLRRSGVSASAILIRRTSPYDSVDRRLPAWLPTMDVWHESDLTEGERGVVRHIPVRLGAT